MPINTRAAHLARIECSQVVCDIAKIPEVLALIKGKITQEQFGDGRIILHHIVARVAEKIARLCTHKPLWMVFSMLPPVLKLNATSLHAAMVVEFILLKNDDDEWKDAFRQTGVLASLVPLLAASSEAALHAARALLNMCFGNHDNRVAIKDEGAIPHLVALLGAGATSETAKAAAGLLQNVAYENEVNKRAICEAGGIAPLVEFVSAGATPILKFSLRVLRNLMSEASCRRAIREANGIPALVALLGTGPEDEAPRSAAKMLEYFPDSEDGAIFECISKTNNPSDVLASFPNLNAKFCHHLESVIAGEDVHEVRAAMDAAERCGALPDFRARAVQRIRELEAQAQIRARQEALGLDGIEHPPEFLCPITLNKMRDPVVASDGHTYERTAITMLLGRSERVASPMTRELLAHKLVPNVALRNLIQGHDAHVLRVAEAAMKRAREDVWCEAAGTKKRRVE